MSGTPSVLLIGNGPYSNRGCEAIVRGTMRILRRALGESVAAQAGVFTSVEVVTRQHADEVDPGVKSFAITGTGPRFTAKWWAGQSDMRFGTTFNPHTWDLAPFAGHAAIALEVGGDNYTLDYGEPRAFMAMDRYLMKRGVPVVIWGASIGPFYEDREKSKPFFDHLRALDGLFVRETETRDYLVAHGVEANVHLVADPAFLLEPVAIPAERLGFDFDAGAIGINLSPLAGQYRGALGDAADWAKLCEEFIYEVAERVGRPILLVPHVGSEIPQFDDYSFMETLHRNVCTRLKAPVKVLPRGLSAAETKWAISHCDVFVGARTHSTIASISLGIPTLSIGYSRKARGITKDVYGDLTWCLGVGDLTPALFRDRVESLVAQRSVVARHLSEVTPRFVAAAWSAGETLRALVRKT